MPCFFEVRVTCHCLGFLLFKNKNLWCKYCAISTVHHLIKHRDGPVYFSNIYFGPQRVWMTQLVER
jgi:hypothetical protein